MNNPYIGVMMLLTIGVTIGIGVHAYREARTQQQYFAYGQQLRWFVLGLATFSTIMSGFGFVGGPGLVYAIGTTSLWMTFAAALGIPFSFMLVGRKLHELSGPDVFTLPDAIHKRFQSQAARFTTAVSILLGIVAYLGSQILAATFVLVQVFGGGFVPSFWCALAVISLYPLIGGISTYTPPWLAGVAFAGLMCAILSTASIFLNVGSATLTRDIPLAFNRPLKHPIFWARTWTAARCGTRTYARIGSPLVPGDPGWGSTGR